MPKRFTYWRNAIVCEVYQVEAESEEEAIELLRNGCCDPVETEWVDWASGSYELEEVKELDPLYRMIKDHKCDTIS
jgi:hypothetical protein